MFASAGVIFLAVMALAACACWGAPELWRGGRGLILTLGLAIPVLLLTALLFYELSIMPGMAAHPREGIRIEVIGKQWWWEVRYYDAEDRLLVTSANEIVIPTGAPVALALSATDVIHSLWVPSLAGKMDMIPGRLNQARLQADRPGTYRAQCAEYCGGQHARMALLVIALVPEDFKAWLARESAPAIEPRSDLAREGRELFLSIGCGACHRVRGIGAEGSIGPELTHIGSRRTIGAGMLPNNVGALAGWIADAQALKPGIGMPPFRILDGESLNTLAAYLASLE